MSIPERSIAVEKLYDELRRTLPETKLVVDPLRRLAYGTDASFYRLVPQLVVIVDDEAELTTVVRACHARGIPFTFRAAGTSLSGQAISDSVLVKLGPGWRGHRLGAGAETISLQPGIIGAHANRVLAPYQRKIGPDPASINACMIGGIAANNASGMCCGTAQNSYQTLVAMRVVLADGTLLDTADAVSRAAFRASHGALLDGLVGLADAVRANPALVERIRHKFKIKNTTGYSLNALVDFDDPFEILQHLLIGSEGTLGFIAEITYRTVPEHPHKASALVFFPDIETACDAVTALKPTPVSAVELIDRAGLRSVEAQPGLHVDLKGFDPEVTALLIEVRGADAAERDAHQLEVERVLERFATVQPVAFTAKPEEFQALWNIRKGMFPAVGAVREAGTTVIIEDVAFPIERLSAAVRELQQLFAKYRYDEAILFGHALEGNLHFVFTQDFGDAAEVARYAGLMDELAELVVGRYDGSLKAEHSTGRNMAPFVEMEWGSDAYALMQRIKALFDPEGLLNPGVILNANPHVHLENLKPLPAADPIVDKCIECGFCEPHCPSRELTLTPRQRITAWRELARLGREAPDDPLRAVLNDAYQYQGIDTCAADGLCSTACPVGINTGDLTRALRHRAGRQHAGRARWLGEHFSGVTGLARLGLRAASATRAVTGDTALGALTRGLRKISGGRMPEWDRWMPRATRGHRGPATRRLPAELRQPHARPRGQRRRRRVVAGNRAAPAREGRLRRGAAGGARRSLLRHGVPQQGPVRRGAAQGARAARGAARRHAWRPRPGAVRHQPVPVPHAGAIRRAGRDVRTGRVRRALRVAGGRAAPGAGDRRGARHLQRPQARPRAAHRGPRRALRRERRRSRARRVLRLRRRPRFRLPRTQRRGARAPAGRP